MAYRAGRWGMRDIHFTAHADGGGPVSGRIEEVIRVGFRTREKTHSLQAENRLRIGIQSNGYALYATPEQDVTIRFLSRHFEVRDMQLWLGAGMVGLIVFAVLALVLSGGT